MRGPDSSRGRFAYHHNPVKTAAAYDHRGQNTIGDLGHVDPDGFVYLPDRRADLIITGCVNVYRQEAEDANAPLDCRVVAAYFAVPRRAR